MRNEKIIENMKEVFKYLTDMPKTRDLFLQGEIFAVAYDVTFDNGKVLTMIGIDPWEKYPNNDEEFTYKSSKLLDALNKYDMFSMSEKIRN